MTAKLRKNNFFLLKIKLKPAKTLWQQEINKTRKSHNLQNYTSVVLCSSKEKKKRIATTSKLAHSIKENKVFTVNYNNSSNKQNQQININKPSQENI